MNSSSSNSGESPLVSVVICSFNPPRDYFQQAIESIRAQTYPNWELIVVDNGTTNGSDTVAKEYAATLPNIRFSTHPNAENKGPAASRNLGIEQAAGEWVAFLDADDFWLPDKLTQQVAAMQAYPAAVLSFGGILRWYDGYEGKVDEAEVHTAAIEVLPPGELIHRLLRNQCIPGMSALMVQTAAARAVGGFEESLFWAEDQTISYKLGLDQTCLVLPDWKVKYRQHIASTTSGIVAENGVFMAHLRFLDWVVNYFSKVEVQDETLWSELRQLHRQYQRLVRREKWMPAILRKAWKRLMPNL